MEYQRQGNDQYNDNAHDQDAICRTDLRAVFLDGGGGWRLLQRHLVRERALRQHRRRIEVDRRQHQQQGDQ